jgi:hypothetical protein
MKMMNFIFIITFDVARREFGGMVEVMGFVTLLILFFYTLSIIWKDGM